MLKFTASGSESMSREGLVGGIVTRAQMHATEACVRSVRAVGGIVNQIVVGPVLPATGS